MSVVIESARSQAAVALRAPGLRNARVGLVGYRHPSSDVTSVVHSVVELLSGKERKIASIVIHNGTSLSRRCERQCGDAYEESEMTGKLAGVLSSPFLRKFAFGDPSDALERSVAIYDGVLHGAVERADVGGRSGLRSLTLARKSNWGGGVWSLLDNLHGKFPALEVLRIASPDGAVEARPWYNSVESSELFEKALARSYLHFIRKRTPQLKLISGPVFFVGDKSVRKNDAPFRAAVREFLNEIAASVSDRGYLDARFTFVEEAAGYRPKSTFGQLDRVDFSCASVTAVCVRRTA